MKVNDDFHAEDCVLFVFDWEESEKEGHEVAGVRSKLFDVGESMEDLNDEVSESLWVCCSFMLMM